MSEKLELVDSHAHLDMEEFDPDRSQVIERAFEAGLRTILCPADLTSPKSIQTTFELKSKSPKVRIFTAAGIHPHQAKLFNSSFNSDCIPKLKELSSSKKINALGEIGLDFHYNFSSPDEQRKAFRCQLSLAQELDLPVIVHSRNAGKEIAAAVQEEHFSRGGVLHCFTEDWNFAKTMLDNNFAISFSGILTFPHAQSLRDIAQKIPLDRLLIETDSPYLVPSPWRGVKKRNEPAFVVETARALADIKKISLEQLAQVTTQNFKNIFGSSLCV